MKTILLCIITTIFFLSCSSDFEVAMQETPSSNNEGETPEINAPVNPENPYDVKGIKFYESLLLYQQEKSSPNSVSELARQIRFLSGQLGRKMATTGRLIAFTDEMVESIMQDPDNSMILIVQNSLLQPYAKTSLIDFLEQLIVERQQQFSITYDYITEYESNVISDSILTAEESETMLTVASISRYSLYSEQERKDRDWETNVGGRPVKSIFGNNEIPIVLIIALLNDII